MNVQLSKTCKACGKERKTKQLRYDPKTFDAYCENPYICESNDHPNSVPNILQRQSEYELVAADDVQGRFEEHLSEQYRGNVEKFERIRTLLTKPFTLRIIDPQMAKFIVEFEDANGMNTTQAVRTCLEAAMLNPASLGSFELPEPEAPQPTPEPAPKKLADRKAEADEGDDNDDDDFGVI